MASLNERDARLEDAISTISELANKIWRLLSSLGNGANQNHPDSESKSNPTAKNSVIRVNTSGGQPVYAMLSMDRQRPSINQLLRNFFPKKLGKGPFLHVPNALWLRIISRSNSGHIKN